MKPSEISVFAQANGNSHWSHLMAFDAAVHSQLVPATLPAQRHSHLNLRPELDNRSA
jgi:hypothetical protein